MPPHELPTEALDTDSSRAGVLSAPASSSAAETDELARAEARAEAARARAIRLRQRADAAITDGEPDEDVTSGERGAESVPSRRWRLHRPGRKAIAFAAAVVVVCAALTASGYLVWYHRQTVQQRQRAAEFATVARNAIMTMLSIDPNKARDDLQRFADETTGIFKVSVLMGDEDLVHAVEESKTSTKGTVQAVAVESMTTDSAVVLIAAKSELTKPGQAKPESRSIRLVVGVKRDAGQLKISRVDTIP